MSKEEFKKCFDLYFDSLRNFLFYKCGNTDTATDIAQDVFMRLWEKDFNYEEKKVKSLLYKLANNQFIDHYRKGQVSAKYINSLRLSFVCNSLELF